MRRDLTRSELIVVVQRLIDMDYHDDEEASALLELLNANVPHPEVSDLIFWPKDEAEATAEHIVDQALAYRPIELGSGDE